MTIDKLATQGRTVHLTLAGRQYSEIAMLRNETLRNMFGSKENYKHKKQVIEWSQTSRLITHNSQLKNMFFCPSIKKESACHHPHLSKYKKKGFWLF